MSILYIMKLTALIGLWFVMAIILSPIIALAIQVLFEKLRFRILANLAEKILGLLLSIQWIINITSNIVGGLAVILLGTWGILAMMSGAPLTKVIIGSPITIPIGIWRIWIGIKLICRQRAES